MDGPICTSNGYCIQKDKYEEHLERVVIPYSTSIGYNFHEGNYFVGSLARLNLNSEALHPETKKDAAEFIGCFPSNNVYFNDLAQAIEILHCIDHAIELMEKFEFKPERLQIIKPKAGTGVGVVEAPRGTLYYKLVIDEKGVITHADVIVPTQQNQINIERDIAQFVEQNLHLDKEKMSLEIEKIVRAYDPCMSCATHFLKINWL
jgi:coenzyme F420-reducing hydrogenase alpha subunit